MNDTIKEVYGPCPDCADGPCILNCGDATITLREIIARSVLFIESAPKNGRTLASYLSLLRALDPAISQEVARRLDERKKATP